MFAERLKEVDRINPRIVGQQILTEIIDLVCVGRPNCAVSQHFLYASERLPCPIPGTVPVAEDPLAVFKVPKRSIKRGRATVRAYSVRSHPDFPKEI